MALTDGLISYWDLDEAGGTRADAHGTNHLTDNNTVGSAAGVSGQAASFVNPGFQDEHLSIPDNPSLRTGDVDFAFACWFRATSLSAIRGILSKFNYNADGREYILHTDGTTLKWIASSDGVQQSEVVFSGLVIDAWYFAVCWHDADADKLYLQVNDAAVAEASFTALETGTSTFMIGGIDGTYEYRWNGEIDAVGFWKRVLDPVERTWLYNNGAGRSYAELTASGGLTGTAETPNLALSGVSATGISGAVSMEAAAAAVVWAAPSGATGQPGAAAAVAQPASMVWTGLNAVTGSVTGAADAAVLSLEAEEAVFAARPRLRSVELSLQPLASISLSLEPLHRIELSLADAL